MDLHGLLGDSVTFTLLRTCYCELLYDQTSLILYWPFAGTLF
jgi:hypothetical protein